MSNDASGSPSYDSEWGNVLGDDAVRQNDCTATDRDAVEYRRVGQQLGVGFDADVERSLPTRTADQKHDILLHHSVRVDIDIDLLFRLDIRSHPNDENGVAAARHPGVVAQLDHE